MPVELKKNIGKKKLAESDIRKSGGNQG